MAHQRRNPPLYPEERLRRRDSGDFFLTAIFGSGFGLYGHLPALVELGHDIAIPARYRSAFDERTELQAYRSAVQFVPDEIALLASASLAVLARRPADNAAMARQCMIRNPELQLVLEKPPAPTPQAAAILDADLTTAGIRYSVPYILKYCDWARDCRNFIESKISAGEAANIALTWYFQSHPAADSWKISAEAGGGVLNYYFIHVLALAAYLLGEYRIVDSRLDNDGSGQRCSVRAELGWTTFRAAFATGPAHSSFSLSFNGVEAINTATPFVSVPRRGVRDPRIDILKQFYREEVLVDGAVDAQVENVPTLKAWTEMAARTSGGE